MRLIEFADPTSFLDRSRRLLMSAEAENNLLLSSALNLAKYGSGLSSVNSLRRDATQSRPNRIAYFIVENDDLVVGAALNSPERRLIISSTDPDSASFMGRELATRSCRVKGVFGPTLAVDAFCSSFDKQLKPALTQKVMCLESPSEHRSAPGLFRAAKEKDFRLLLQWSIRFVQESGLDEEPSETEDILRRYIENKQLFIWETSRPVAMAGWNGSTPNGVRVNMVYTDPLMRGRGYAETLVHLLSRKLLTSGHKFCFLFTDATNGTANRLYERIGYKAVADFSEYRT